MIVAPFESQLDPNAIGGSPYETTPGGPPASSFLGISGGIAPSTDAIARMIQPQNSFYGGAQPGVFGGAQSCPFGGGLWSAIQGLLQQLSSMLSQFTDGAANSGMPSEQYFSSANGGSIGDPHLSFNGATWDNMGNQPDLLHSDSFAGGFSLATQTTPPNGQGVAWNQQATISTNYGANTVSMDNTGAASVTMNGMPVALQAGTPLNLGNGDTVTLGTDGSVQMTANNGLGGSITTTLRKNGNGVDVTCSANNVDLGGALADGPNNPLATPPPSPLGGNNGLPGLWQHPRPILPIAYQQDDLHT